jgi:hypothetical protein
MQLVAQLVGTAGGGAVNLGDIHVLQVFADLEGEFYEPDSHAVVVHREPCTIVVEPPATVEVSEVRAMTFESGFDDRRLLAPDPDELEGFESDAAHAHAWCDKLGGIPVGANLDPDVRGPDGAPMRLLLELVSYDDWFLWALFANDQLDQFRLEIVRG